MRANGIEAEDINWELPRAQSPRRGLVVTRPAWESQGPVRAEPRIVEGWWKICRERRSSASRRISRGAQQAARAEASLPSTNIRAHFPLIASTVASILLTKGDSTENSVRVSDEYGSNHSAALEAIIVHDDERTRRGSAVAHVAPPLQRSRSLPSGPAADGRPISRSGVGVVVVPATPKPD